MIKPELTPSYDISLRNIFAAGGRSFLRMIAMVGDEKLDTDVSKITKRNVDMLRESGEEILHLEYQRSHDARMSLRMLDYGGAILSALTSQDAKYNRFSLRQALIHVGRSAHQAKGKGEEPFGELITFSRGSVRVRYRSIGTLDLPLDAAENWDAGDAALSIICRNGDRDDIISKALRLIYDHPNAPELLGCYLRLGMAVEGAYGKIILRSTAMGAEIDLEQIPQFRDMMDSRIEKAVRAKSEQIFWETAKDLFPYDEIDDDLKAAVAGLTTPLIDAARRSLRDHATLREAVLGPSTQEIGSP
ncbi:MAG: hypothetical protein P0Y65_17095 [Candidatus Devosia phytovorans]|uniref:Uncharacterized protein n=1 Tax=Candidatus Devosia phytovorans TaxID=3121372 RepID=A0AAJ5VUV1_9HYPH|nr:hypothetical protein [Devosia sp.]WEK03888.1 MAG: hypothetical protein P0Y65_17095 [Devosia sp.]